MLAVRPHRHRVGDRANDGERAVIRELDLNGNDHALLREVFRPRLKQDAHAEAGAAVLANLDGVEWMTRPLHDIVSGDWSNADLVPGDVRLVAPENGHQGPVQGEGELHGPVP